MKKLLFALSLMPVYAFAFQVGTNYIGAGLGKIDYEITLGSGSGSADGEIYKFGGNYNLHNIEGKYGIDLFAGASFGDGDSNLYDGDMQSYAIGVRPFLPAGIMRFYFEGIYNWGETELKVKSSGQTTKSDSDTFVPGLGFQLDIGNLTIDPSLHFVRDDVDSDVSSVSLYYKLTSEYSIGAEYQHSDYNSVTVGSSTLDQEIETLSFGVTYNF